MATEKEPSTAAMSAAFTKHVEMEQRRGAPVRRDYVYASARRKCLRRMVYEATVPELQPEFPTEAKARMMRGTQRERDMVIDLQRAGRHAEPAFDFIGQQEAVRLTDRSGKVVISGKIDGRIRWADGSSWPAEIKDWSPNITERIETFEDLFLNPWTWSGAHQLLSYLYGKPEPVGVLILSRPGLPKFIEVRLEEHLDAMEAFLADAESAQEHIILETLPDYIGDADECRRCSYFGSVCNPPTSVHGAAVLTDPDLIARLERREELKGAANEFDHLDASIKKEMRGVENGIAGPFVVQGKWGKNTSWEFPSKEVEKAVKEQYQKTDPKGRFTLSLVRI